MYGRSGTVAVGLSLAAVCPRGTRAGIALAADPFENMIIL